ncbi:MAG: oligosaccharide flippase family protein, partial [Ramlibacter sp.]
MSVARQFAVNVVAQGLARMLSIGPNIVLMIVVARTMGTAYFGQFSYVLAFSTIAVSLADLGTTAVLARGLAQHGEARAAYLGNFLLMRLAVTLIVMVGACGIVFALPGNLHAALLIVAVGLPALATRFFEPIFQVYGKPWLSPWSNMVLG